MENDWTSPLFGHGITLQIHESTAQCDDTWKQSESERFMAKKRPHKRANLEQRQEDREIYDLLPGSRTLSRIWCSGYKRHTMLSWTRTMGHPLVPGGITTRARRNSRKSGTRSLGRFFYDHIGRDDTQDVRVSCENMTSQSHKRWLPLPTLCWGINVPGVCASWSSELTGDKWTYCTAIKIIMIYELFKSKIFNRAKS